MDKILKQHKDALAAAAAEMEALLAVADEESRELADDEESRFAELDEQCQALKGKIAAREKVLEARSRIGDYATEANRPQASVTNGAPAPRITRQHDNRQDDPQAGFANIGEFALAVHRAGPQENWASDERLAMLAAAGSPSMQYGDQSYGGALVPPAFSRTIWDGLMTESESLMGMCDSISVPEGTESLSFPAMDETSRADGSRHGGIRGYWKAEETQMTATRPKFREVKFEPQELYVFAYVSDKLLRNASALASYLPRAARDEINFKVGDAIYNGDGAGKPIGMATSSNLAKVSVSKETGQAAATIVSENIEKMYNRMHARALSGAVWLINQDCYPQLQSLSKAVGTSGQLVWIPPGGLTQAPFGTLMGKPVMPIEYCAALGTEGDIMFVNPKFYGVATRSGIKADASIHLKFDYNQTAFRFIFEVDGQPWVNSAVTAFKGSTTRSPFITLATRS